MYRKLLLAVMSLLLFGLFVNTLLNLSVTRQILGDELAKRAETLLRSVQQKCQYAVTVIDQNSGEAYVDRKSLDDIVRNVERYEPDVARMLIVDRDNRVLSSLEPSLRDQQPAQLPFVEDCCTTDHPKLIWRADQATLEVMGPVLINGYHWGRAFIAFSLKPMRHEIRHLGLQSLVLGLLFTLVSVLLAIPLVHALVRPIRRLSEHAVAIGEGNFEQEIEVRSQDEIGQLAMAFRLMVSRLIERERTEREIAAAKASSEAKSAFLASMSHELRTPMNAIIGFADLALASKLKPRQADYLHHIRQAAESLLRLINDILDFSKTEAGKLKLEAIEFEFDQVLQTSLATVEPQAADKGLRLSMDLDSAIPITLVGDPLRLGQVITNLLGNAVKFTERGEIRLTARAHRLAEDRLRLAISIADTGIGMTDEQVGRLFNAFSQGDSSTSRRYGGTGLGLAICKNLVGLMQGQIEVSSRVGEGSRFRFEVCLGYVPACASTEPGWGEPDRDEPSKDQPSKDQPSRDQPGLDEPIRGDRGLASHPAVVISETAPDLAAVEVLIRRLRQQMDADIRAALRSLDELDAMLLNSRQHCSFTRLKQSLEAFEIDRAREQLEQLASDLGVVHE